MPIEKTGTKKASIRDFFNWLVKNFNSIFTFVKEDFDAESKIHPRLLWSANLIAAHVIIA